MSGRRARENQRAEDRRAIETDLLWQKINELILNGRLLDAAEAQQQLCELEPHIAIHQLNYGLILMRMERYEDALMSFAPLKVVLADTAPVWVGLGLSNYFLGRPRESGEFFGKALKLDPENIPAKIFLARGLLDLGEFRTAREVLSTLTGKKLQPDEANLYALALMDLDEFAEAEKVFLSALSENSDDVLLINLASLYERGNQIDKAKSLLTKVRSLDDFGKYLAARLMVRSGDSVTALNQLNILKKNVSSERSLPLQAQIDFERGKILESQGHFEEAFAAYAAGNRKDEAIFQRYNGASADDSRASFFVDIPALDNAASLKTASASASPERMSDPVFIVGFPRSGTTLLDRMLGKHQAIQIIEERPVLEPIVEYLSGRAEGYPASIATLTVDEVEELRRRYWQEVSKYIEIKPGVLVIEKNPFNMLRAHLIKLLFPRAKWIFSVRHPCDVVFSCFARRYGYTSITRGFSNIDDIAELYNRCTQLWLSHEERLSLNSTTAKYENLVVSAKSELSRIVNFLDLKWDNSVLDFEQTREQDWVLTPSYDQVSQKLYSHSIGRWLNYRNHFASARNILDPISLTLGYPPIDESL